MSATVPVRPNDAAAPDRGRSLLGAIYAADAFGPDLVGPFVPDDPNAFSPEGYSGLERALLGLAVERHELPARAGLTGAGVDEPAAYTLAGGWPLVRADLAHLLRRFDLGAGALHPIAIEGTSNDWFVWAFGNRRNAFLWDRSHGCEEPMNEDRVWSAPWRFADGDIAVSGPALTNASDGHADVWMDEALSGALFVSERLGAALTEAGFADALRLRTVRVLDAPLAPWTDEHDDDADSLDEDDANGGDR